MTETTDFGPGRLTTDWFNTTPEINNPWLLETRDPFAEGHSDAFLGNGIIGQRIGVDGDASAIPFIDPTCYINASGCLKHGFWNETSLMDLPRWAILSYNDGQADFTTENGTWSNYHQSLDMQTAILQTELDWENNGQTTRIEKKCFLSRSRPNIALLAMTITPDFDGDVTVNDIIDGSAIDYACDWNCQALGVDNLLYVADSGHTGIMSVEARFGAGRKRLVVMSRLVLGDNTKPSKLDMTQEEQFTGRKITLSVKAGQSYTINKIVAIVSDSDSPCPSTTAFNYVEGAAGNLKKLENDHIKAWQDVWQHHIEVPSYHTQKILNTSLYQLYSHLRAGGTWSLGPAGLSGTAWAGHAFWDSDLWMFPGLALLNPDLSKGFVEYRHLTIDGARRNAMAEGYEGAMFAWESAESGDETIPERIYHHQHHVNSDIALAQWWYYLVSGDETYLKEKAAEIIIESARFWASYAEYNAELDRYEIKQVCCADEFAEIRDNNTYTNYSAVKNIQLAKKAADLTGQTIPQEWLEIADKMWLPFDEENQRYLEYEGYNGETIKQADTAILVYPYEMPMRDDIKANVVDYYSSKYPEGNIMMAAAFDGIVDCELGRSEKCWNSFMKLIPHFREPFLLASESPKNNIISFATGLGGLLQLWMMGYAGIRMHDDGLLVQPCLPPEVPSMLIKGIHYKGVSFDLAIEGNHVHVTNASDEITFKIYDRSGNSWLK